MLLKRKQKITI